MKENVFRGLFIYLGQSDFIPRFISTIVASLPKNYNPCSITEMPLLLYVEIALKLGLIIQDDINPAGFEGGPEALTLSIAYQ